MGFFAPTRQAADDPVVIAAIAQEIIDRSSADQDTAAALSAITESIGAEAAVREEADSALGTAVSGKLASNDPSVTNARTPVAHKSTHAAGGTDALSPADIGAAAAVAVNALTTRVGATEAANTDQDTAIAARALAADLATEATARANADSALGTSVAGKASITALANEATARGDADTALAGSAAAAQASASAAGVAAAAAQATGVAAGTAAAAAQVTATAAKTEADLLGTPVTSPNYTTQNIANGAGESGAIALAKQFRINRILVDRACRVRLYSSAAHRDADVARPSTADPSGDHGCIAEWIFSAATSGVGAGFDCVPPPQGGSWEAPRSANIAIRIENLSGALATVTVAFNYQPLEV